MKYDPAISTVREARHRISEAVGNDPIKLVEYYRRLQERHQDRLVKQGKKRQSSEDAA